MLKNESTFSFGIGPIFYEMCNIIIKDRIFEYYAKHFGHRVETQYGRRKLFENFLKRL